MQAFNNEACRSTPSARRRRALQPSNLGDWTLLIRALQDQVAHRASLSRDPLESRTRTPAVLAQKYIPGLPPLMRESPEKRWSLRLANAGVRSQNWWLTLTANVRGWIGTT